MKSSNKGIPIEAPPHFPVKWDTHEESTLLWSWDSFHSPLPMSPLGASIASVVSHGSELALRELGINVPKRPQKRINGFAYNAVLEKTDGVDHLKLRHVLGTTRKKWDREWVPELEADLAVMKAVDLQSLSDTRLLEVIDHFFEKHKRHWTIHFLVVHPAVAAIEQLDEIFSRLTGGNAGTEAHKLMDNSHTKTIEVNQALAGLAEQATEFPIVVRILKSTETTVNTISLLEKSENGRRWLEMFEDFLEQYGYRPTGFDIRFPTWKEDPSFVFLIIRNLIQNPKTNLASQHAQMQRMREQQTILSQANETLKFSPEQRAEFEESLRLARELWPLKEDHAFFIDQASTAVVQHSVKEIGRRLVERNLLDDLNDFYYLKLSEARNILLNGGDVIGLVAERRATHERWGQLTPPRYLGTIPAEGKMKISSESTISLGFERSRLLRGDGASAGTASGPARIVKSPTDFENVKSGDILICRSTSATWTPLFDIVSGLVSEAGGILSHPAVIAREYGLPAVVGVQHVTEMVSDGDIVYIDGSAGTIQLA